MNFSTFKVMYWTKSVTNSNDDGSDMDAVITEIFTSNLVERASDYVLAVERFEISLNGIPYYDGTSADTWYLMNGNNIAIEISCDFKAYTIFELIYELNIKLSQSSGGQLSIELTSHGYVQLIENNAFPYTHIIPAKLNLILGLVNEATNKVNHVWRSTHTRFGIGDHLDHIRISSNLPLVSDTIGQAKENVVTDFAPAWNISLSEDGSKSGNPRDKLLYTPATRRYLNLNSSAPIQLLRLYVESLNQFGESSIVKIPYGGTFSIKLGFYKRT